MVPRLRVWRWPTCSIASCMSGKRSRTSIGEFELALARHGADLERPVAVADIGEALDPVEIDDVVRQHEAHVEHRHQRLAAGQKLGVVERPSSSTASATVLGSW